MSDPYGVPTAYVPRRPGEVFYVEPPRRLKFVDAIERAVDEYLAMERDAKLWREHNAREKGKQP